MRLRLQRRDLRLRRRPLLRRLAVQQRLPPRQGDRGLPSLLDGRLDAAAHLLRHLRRLQLAQHPLLGLGAEGTHAVRLDRPLRPVAAAAAAAAALVASVCALGDDGDARTDTTDRDGHRLKVAAVEVESGFEVAPLAHAALSCALMDAADSGGGARHAGAAWELAVASEAALDTAPRFAVLGGRLVAGLRRACVPARRSLQLWCVATVV